jgi:hypothetical protein
MIYKKGRYYMVKFMWQGRMIRKSTRCTSAKDARTVEGKIRSELGKGNWGILEATPAPHAGGVSESRFSAVLTGGRGVHSGRD